MAGFTWYPHRIALLKRLASEGKSARQIAAHFGVSRNAVIGASHRNGVKLLGKPLPISARSGGRPGAPDATKVEAVTLNLCGYALAVVAGRYGVTIFTICRWKAQPHILERAKVIAERIGGATPKLGRPPGRAKRPMVLTQAERERRSAWMSKVSRDYWDRVRTAQQAAG